MTGIFLSYARGDDEQFVRRLYDDLIEAGFTVWFDRVSMPSRALTFLQEIRDAIAASDRLLLVVGPKAVASDYVAAEWRCALELCVAVTSVLRLGDYNLVPAELSVHHCPDARPERAYADALSELLRILADPVPPLASLYSVPSLPAHFLPRPADLAFLDETVLADVQRPTVITSAKQTTALQGMGGVGKSVLAAAFARSCEARRAFGDGVVWLTLGQQPDLLRLALTLAAALKDDLAEYSDLQRARGRLPKLLADKKYLLVLDDAWDVAHAEIFANALGPRCRLLVTTRDGGLAAALGAQERRLDVLEPDAALSLLADWAGQPGEALPAKARAVAAECGNLPFALALCGAMARDGAPWADLLDALAEADLAFLRVQFPNYPYPDVLRALKVSVDALAASDPTWARHYQELAVFPADEAVPEAAIVQLWVHTNGLNERAARQLLTTLGRKSLVRLEGQAPHRHVALHDLQHDYLRAALHDLTGLHAELLAAYREKCPEGWHAGPNDGYFFERLTWHLARAGWADELRSLLLDYRWIRAKLGASGPAALIADYDVALDPSATGRTGDETVRLVQGAIRLSAHVLARDATQLPSQITGRLLARQEEEIQTLLEQMQMETKTPWLRPLSPSLAAPSGALMRTLHGHSNSVLAVTVTPDGRRAVSGSSDRTLKVWDLENGAELASLCGHEGRVNTVAVTPDGKLAVSGSYDKTLKVWDLEKGMELTTLNGHEDEVNTVAVTADGRRAVSGSSDKTLKVWDMENGVELATLRGHSSGVAAVAVTPDGQRVISGSYDTTLKVWDLEGGTELITLRGHKGAIGTVAVTPDGRSVVSGDSSLLTDHALKVWDLKSGIELATMLGHKLSVEAVAVTPDGRRAVSGSSDRTLKVWDLESRTELTTLGGHSSWISTVSVTPDGRKVISGSWDRTLKVWDLEKRAETPTSRGHNARVEAVAVTPDGRRAVSGSNDKTLKVWDLKNGAELATLSGHSSGVTALAVTPDGRRVVAMDQYTLRVWDLNDEKELANLYGPDAAVTSVVLTSDARLAVYGGKRTLKLLDLQHGEYRTVSGEHREAIVALAVTPDGRRAVSGSWDETLKVWDLEKGAETCTLRGHDFPVVAVAVTPDGRRAVSGSWDKTLKVWDLESGAELTTLRGHSGGVAAVAVTPNGRRAVSGSEDETLRVWDLEKGAETSILCGHNGGVEAVAVTPDGLRAVSSSKDETLKVWDLKSGVALATYMPDGARMHFSITPGGRSIVVGDTLGHVHSLHLKNIIPGPTVMTVWRPIGVSIPMLGCLYCRTWSQVPTSALGTELPCPKCGKPVKLNPFVIEADWRPVAAAWRGDR